MYFNPIKSIHLSINSKVMYWIQNSKSRYLTRSVHKDLGIVMSNDLSWNQHYEKIIPKAYRMLGLLRRFFSQFESAFTYTYSVSLVVRSQVTYCSIVWRPNLIKDIILVEQIQRRVTKFIIILVTLTGSKNLTYYP